MAVIQELFEAIGKGQKNDVAAIVQHNVDNGVDVRSILNESMIPAMRSVGDKFSRGEAFVPEMLIAARAMQAGLDIIEPILAEGGHKPVAKVAIGTVKGDLHDIGKNLVAMMLKGAGLDVVDLGVDCDINKFSDAVAQGCSAVLCSALLTTTMPYMKTIAEHFKEDDNVKVIIGGAPVTQAYADEIGADGYGTDANDAVRIVEQCLKLAS